MFAYSNTRTVARIFIKVDVGNYTKNCWASLDRTVFIRCFEQVTWLALASILSTYTHGIVLLAHILHCMESNFMEPESSPPYLAMFWTNWFPFKSPYSSSSISTSVDCYTPIYVHFSKMVSPLEVSNIIPVCISHFPMLVTHDTFILCFHI